MVSRIFVLSTWVVAAATMLLMFPDRASSETHTEFTAFRYTSPEAREIVVSDTATMDEVLEVLRSNNVPVDGPHEILQDDGKGGQFVGGYKIHVALITYNPGGATNPRCPYKQTTSMIYGKDRRLQHYSVGIFVTCNE